MIWIIRITPNNDPQFHIYEIEDGAGRSTNILNLLFNIGWIVLILFFIFIYLLDFIGLNGFRIILVIKIIAIIMIIITTMILFQLFWYIEFILFILSKQLTMFLVLGIMINGKMIIGVDILLVQLEVFLLGISDEMYVNKIIIPPRKVNVITYGIHCVFACMNIMGVRKVHVIMIIIDIIRGCFVVNIVMLVIIVMNFVIQNIVYLEY